MYQGKRTQLQALTGVRKYVLLGAIVVLVLAVSISATIAGVAKTSRSPEPIVTAQFDSATTVSLV